jgi:hypothetical protein
LLQENGDPLDLVLQGVELETRDLWVKLQSVFALAVSKLVDRGSSAFKSTFGSPGQAAAGRQGPRVDSGAIGNCQKYRK